MVEGTEVLSNIGAVAAGPPGAAKIGAKILSDGGNAMDAAAATCLACCMLHPVATGLGGYILAAVVLEVIEYLHPGLQVPPRILLWQLSL